MRLSDLGTHTLGFCLGAVQYVGLFAILGTMRGALGIEPIGNLFPPFRRLFRAFGLGGEAREFIGDETHGAVCDEALHGMGSLGGGVVEAAV